ncbi:MAG: Rieske (2Fe-2S) protein [Planctomycetota bacterium]
MEAESQHSEIRLPRASVLAGSGTVVRAGNHEVAVFQVGAEYHAIDNRCPHNGGPLARGFCDGQYVYCPWHDWGFDVTTGKSVGFPEVAVAHYRVQVEGADLVIVLHDNERTRPASSEAT